MNTLELMPPAADESYDSELNAPPRDAAHFVRQIIREAHFRDSSDRRRHLRYPLALAVEVCPLAAEGRAPTKPFFAVMRDISTAGACLYAVQPILEKQVRLKLASVAGDECWVKLNIARSGYLGPLFYFAGEFEFDGTDGEVD